MDQQLADGLRQDLSKGTYDFRESRLAKEHLRYFGSLSGKETKLF